MITHVRCLKNSLLVMLIFSLITPVMQCTAEQEIVEHELPQEVDVTLFNTNDTDSKETKLQEIEPPLWKKAVHVAITALPMRLSIISIVRELYPTESARYLLRAQDTLSPETQALTADVITLHNLNPEDYTLLNIPGDEIAYAIGQKTMVVNDDLVKQITEDESKFLIAHELAHLQNKDNLKIGLAALTAPFIAHYGLKAWDASIRALLSSVKRTFGITSESNTGKVLDKINDVNHWISTFCGTKFLVGMHLVCAYSRYVEMQADISSVTHLKTSEGAERFFTRLKDFYKRLKTENPNLWIISPEGENLMDSLHPTLAQRIEYTKACAQAF